MNKEFSVRLSIILLIWQSIVEAHCVVQECDARMLIAALLPET